jgi:hypothetical protein
VWTGQRRFYDKFSKEVRLKILQLAVWTKDKKKGEQLCFGLEGNAIYALSPQIRKWSPTTSNTIWTWNLALLDKIRKSTLKNRNIVKR